MLCLNAMVCLLGLLASPSAESIDDIVPKPPPTAMNRTVCDKYNTSAARYQQSHFSPRAKTRCELLSLGPGALSFEICCFGEESHEAKCKLPYCMQCQETMFKILISTCYRAYPDLLKLALCQIDHVDDFKCNSTNHTQGLSLAGTLRNFFPGMHVVNTTAIKSIHSHLSMELDDRREQVTSRMAPATLFGSAQSLAAMLLLGMVIGSLATTAAFHRRRQEMEDIYVRA